MRSEPKSKPIRWVLTTLLLVALGAALVWLDRRLTSAGLFLRFESDTAAPSWLSKYRERPVDEELWSLPYGEHARLYLPRGAKPRRALLLLHGMHPAGIDEPRFVGFAKAIASTGVLVGTPELKGLKHFGVGRADLVNAARAASLLASEVGREQVAVFGVSFGGGLALRAACEPALSKGIGRVIALGAPYDLERVARFALGHAVRGPDGELADVKPHPYARLALETFLLGPAFVPPRGPAADRALEQGLLLHAPVLKSMSPASCRQRIHVPVNLAHGLGDRVVPYTETLWLARELPVDNAPNVLISPVIEHAQYVQPTLSQRLQLIEFMAKASEW